MQLSPAFIRASLTQTYWPRTLQQLGLAVSLVQSVAWAQMCRVSVPWQYPTRVVLQAATHLEATDPAAQFGAWPPFRTIVSQQSWLPPQSPGCRQSSVSALLHDEEHATVALPGLAQQT